MGARQETHVAGTQRIAGVELERALHLGQSLLGPADQIQPVAESHARRRVAGIELDRELRLGNCDVEPLGPNMSLGVNQMGHRGVRILGDRPSGGLHSIGDESFPIGRDHDADIPHVTIGEAGMGVTVLRIETKRPREAGSRRRVIIRRPAVQV